MLEDYQIELRHIRYFMAVAEELHFRRAAEKLYISQPGLSRQIRQMEEELDLVLFERHNRKVILTEAGRYLYNQFQRHYTQLSKTLHKANQIHHGLKGELSISYVGSAMQKVIPDLLVEYRTKHPGILFNLKEMNNSEQVDGILSEDIDIGFVRMDQVPVGIEKHIILEERFCLVLPENHRLGKENYTSMSQLQDEPFIFFEPSYSPSYYAKVMQIFHDHNFVPNVTNNTIHSNSIYKLVKHEFGISIVPESLFSDRDEGIKFIPLDIEQKAQLSIIWKTDKQSANINNFKALAHAYINVKAKE